MTHVTYKLTTKNRDQLRNPTLANPIWVLKAGKTSCSQFTAEFDRLHAVDPASGKSKL